MKTWNKHGYHDSNSALLLIPFWSNFVYESRETLSVIDLFTASVLKILELELPLKKKHF